MEYRKPEINTLTHFNEHIKNTSIPIDTVDNLIDVFFKAAPAVATEFPMVVANWISEALTMGPQHAVNSHSVRALIDMESAFLANLRNPKNS